MTTKITHDKSSADAATPTEPQENTSRVSQEQCYLVRPGESTRNHFGTWSGTQVAKSDFILVVMPMKVAQRIVAAGPQLIDINAECVTKQSAAVRVKRAKLEEEEQRQQRAAIIRELEETVFAAEVQQLDDANDDLFARLEKAADERLRHSE